MVMFLLFLCKFHEKNGSHIMTVLYPTPCYNKLHTSWTALCYNTIDTIYGGELVKEFIKYSKLYKKKK